MKHLLTLHDWSTEDIKKALNLAARLKQEQKDGIPHPYLAGKTLGMIFTKSSTRTRVSFEVGMYQLGGNALFLSANDIQLGRGETIHDTAKVLSRFLDGIMIRTFKQSDVEDLAKYGSIPIINGLTDLVHPCQILADFLTIKEHLGDLAGKKIAYVGDGNNITHSLLFGCAKLGMEIAVATPAQYACDPEVVKLATEDAAKTGAKITITTDPKEAVKDADAVFTDTWVSMGQEDQKAEKVKAFSAYQVNDELMAFAKDSAIFLHCLPAYRGYEVTDSVIDGAQSVVFDEAENRLHAQKAVMVMLMSDEEVE